MNIESKEIARQAFSAQALCSRKLWELVTTNPEESVGEAQLREAVAELELRRHYLSELQQLGKLEDH